MSNDQKSTQRFPGPNTVEDLGISAEPELLGTEYLEAYRQLFFEDDSNVAQPYMALASIFFDFLNRHTKPTSGDLIAVPFWVAQAITKGFMKYFNAVEQGKNLRFGVAMGFEGRGKGTKPQLVRELRRMRDFKLALLIAIKVEDGQKVTLAVKTAADEFMVSESVAWRVWGKHKGLAEECLSNYRAAAT